MPRLNLLLRSLLCFATVLVPLSAPDQWAYDQFFRLRGRLKRPTPFVLVRVNDPAPLSSRGGSVWEAKIYTPLLQRILADRPLAVVFTSHFDTVDGPTAPRSDIPILFSAALNEEEKLVPPSPLLAVGLDYGFVNLFPEADNTVRKHRLIYSSTVSLAVRLYHRLGRPALKRDLGEPFWIDFRGPAGSYPSYFGDEVLEPEFRHGTFTGKIVLIGKEESPARFVDTPFGRMSRQEIHANIADTLLSGREICRLPREVTLITSLVAVALAIGIILTFPLTLAWLFLLLLSLVITLLALLIFSQAKLWAGVANPLVCLFASHAILLGYKLSRQEEQQWRIQQESEYFKELDKFKNNFISLFSHDLKTPIARIKAVTERLMMENRSLDAEAKDGLRAIERASAELARLISDILKVTKMESMPLEPVREVLDLNRLVESTAQRLKYLADEKKITLLLDLEPLFSMEGDPQLIQEVVTNLIENAVKYSPQGTRVVVRTQEDTNRVRVEVTDEGIGIPADELPRVTGKFYRGRTAVETTKGTGLGLYLAKYFVELHHGGLEIQSELGKGTRVSFWLPLPA